MVKFPRVFTGLWAFHKAFYGLIRRLQTTVEHMRVTANDADFVRGNVIALTDGVTAGQRQGFLADASAATGGYPWAGVMAEDTAEDATGIARINGYGYVLFDEGLDPAPAPGDPVYLSETAGRATNVAPVTVGAYVQRIGTVGNGAPYATENAAWVWLQHCCTPTQR